MFRTRFDALDLEGELRRYPVTIHGAAEVTAGNRWQLAALQLDSGPNRIVLDGALDADDARARRRRGRRASSTSCGPA